MIQYNGRELDSTDYRDADILEWLYWSEDNSLYDIGDIFGVRAETIRTWMEKNGIDRRQQPDATAKALTLPYAPLEMHDHGQMRWGLHHDGDSTHMKVSRLLAISEFGFDAVCGKIVHHKNGIPWDDRPENIELMTQSEHAKHHWETGDLGRE